MCKVFVYGTLKVGYRNHILLQEAEYKGEGILHGYGVFNMSVGFPGIRYSESNYVVGEVYDITEAELQRLDELEGYYGEENKRSNMYNRIEVKIRMETGERIRAYTYEWNGKKPTTEEFIDNGKWNKYGTILRNS